LEGGKETSFSRALGRLFQCLGAFNSRAFNFEKHKKKTSFWTSRVSPLLGFSKDLYLLKLGAGPLRPPISTKMPPVRAVWHGLGEVVFGIDQIWT